MAEIKTKSVKLNMVMNALLSMSSFIFPLITFPYVSRILLPVGTGRVAFATAVVTYFAMFAQLGIPTYGIRLCAKVRDNKEELPRAVHELLFINLFMPAIVSGRTYITFDYWCNDIVECAWGRMVIQSIRAIYVYYHTNADNHADAYADWHQQCDWHSDDGTIRKRKTGIIF